MIGLDRRDVSEEDATALAQQIHDAARVRIRSAVSRFPNNPGAYVISGHGDDLIDMPTETTTIRLQDELGPEISRCAPSYAVARLLQRTEEGARERCLE